MSEKELAVVELTRLVSESEPTATKDRRYWFELFQMCEEVVIGRRLPYSIAQEIQQGKKERSQ